MSKLWRLRDFIKAMTRLVERYPHDEMETLRFGGQLLGELIANDDWLPEAFALPHPLHHQEYLLYCDPLERFAVLSLAFGPGQKTPVHDHLTWCLSGVLRGQENFEEYRHDGEGLPMRKCESHLSPRGEVDAVSPTLGDIHVISNARQDETAVSIHVFGGNIGVMKRNKFFLATGERHDYISGYANDVLPNIWGVYDRGPGSSVEWSIE